MRKIKMFNMVSVDGYFADEEGKIDWHTVDDEFNKFAVQNLDTVDTYIFGRVTYQMFENYWPEVAKDPETGPEDKLIADALDQAQKIVFSKSLKDVTWHGAELRKEINADEVRKWKQQDGKDMMIFGSGTIVCEMTKLGLIDEYGFMVSPVILGAGKPLFKDLMMSLKLHELEVRPFPSTGNVLLTYKTPGVLENSNVKP